MSFQGTSRNPLSNTRVWRRLGPFCARSLLIVAVTALMSPAAVALQCGDYTQAQAQRGSQVFAAHCAACHGVNLHGQAGPALVGPSFKGSLEFSKMSAAQLFHFISTQMPRSDPGSLEQQQYLDVLAFILSKNGYPAGSNQLTPSLLKRVKLLPYPDNSKVQKQDQ